MLALRYITTPSIRGCARTFGTRNTSCYRHRDIVVRPFSARRVSAYKTVSSPRFRSLSTVSSTHGIMAAASSSSSPPSSASFRKSVAVGVAGGLLLAGLHSATGSENEFFEYRFKANRSPDDLATFYGGEEFMELFCILPVVGQIMMRRGYFDEDGNIITQGIPGTLKVSMVFSSEEDNETGETEWFNKRERFRDLCFGYTCWDMVLNFGFRTTENGEIECYHTGEYFHGNVPLVSQIMKLVFKIHARWLAWSAEHHINHFAFTATTEEEEMLEEESRRNMPLFLLKHYAFSDLWAMIFGVKEMDDDKSSFLIRRKETDTGDGIAREGLGEKVEEQTLPVRQDAAKIQIKLDIASDRRAVKEMLARNETRLPEEVNAVLSRGYTVKTDGRDTQKRRTDSAYGAAMEAARLHHLTRRQSLSKVETASETQARGVDSVTDGDNTPKAIKADVNGNEDKLIELAKRITAAKDEQSM